MHARRLSLILVLLCPLLALWVPEAGASVEKTVMFLNSRQKLAEESVFSFTAPESGEYIFAQLPEGDAVCRVETGGSVWAQGALPLRAELREGREYTVTVTGGADTTFEIMRGVHSRCMESPITISENTLRYTKSITHPRDVHWYVYTAPEDGLYTFRTETADERTVDTKGYLMDESGRTLAYSDDIIPGVDGNFRIFYPLKKGSTVYIRVSALSNDTGLYRLAVIEPVGGEAEIAGISVQPRLLTLDYGRTAELAVTVSPDDAYGDLAYSTSDMAVAKVSPEGVITAVAAGDAVITVSGYGGASAQCHVKVNPVPLVSLSLKQSDLRIPLGGSVRLTPLFTPEYATDRAVTYWSDNEQVAVVDESGCVTAVGEGRCLIHLRGEGDHTAAASVTVTPKETVYRALVVSEHMYEDGRTRVGAINTAQGMADMLETGGYSVSMLLDATYGELTAGVEAAFSGAGEEDVCLFYLNCHGKVTGGRGYIELHDGTRLGAAQLFRLLKDVKGRTVILLDFCQSGAFLSCGPYVTPFCGSRFLVMTSCDGTQDSYRLGSSRDASEAGMATVFARAVTEGCGWNLDRDVPGLKRADGNGDGNVTFGELYAFVQREVKHDLCATGVTQSPMTNAPGDALILLPGSE